MELLTKEKISSTIRKIKPSTVVVAYIGADWKDYIDPKLIERIVIAPTLGSNPYGIESLKNALGGWKKIGFLDNLHAKLYLGKDSAVIGSPNLSRNALGEGGLEELAIETNDKSIIKDCKTFASDIWQESQLAYPSDEAKNNRLQWLKDARSTMSKAIEKNAPLFSDYDYSKNKIYPVWWFHEEPEDFNHPILVAAGIDNVQINDLEGMDFAEGDEINSDAKWLLCYKISKGKASSKSMSFLYRHYFLENGSKDKEYPNSWIEIPGEIKPSPPFKIDKYFKEAFTKVINSGKYDLLLDKQQGDIWYVKNTTSLLPKFFKDLKQEYKNISGK